MSQPPSLTPGQALATIHAGWRSKQRPTVADAEAYLLALDRWQKQYQPGSPPDQEPEIQTPEQLWAWCRHRQDHFSQLALKPPDTMPPIIVGVVEFAWECLRRVSGTQSYPPGPGRPQDYATAIRHLDQVIQWCCSKMSVGGNSSQLPPSAPQPQQVPASLPSPGIASPAPQAPSVQLGKQGDQPIVLGTRKQSLRSSQYNVVQALLAAGAIGLTKDTLVTKSGHGDAVKILKRLAKSDADWAKVIQLPGTSGKGYRIV